ncbi:MAG: cytochrome c maturation protein CcmE [Deltaproteobacteria bacterium]|nr:cytochrome c maturation protein CcmE [Deltaproteobacteria bacterium]
MKRGLKILASVVVVGGSVAYLLSQSFGEQMVYSKYVDELLAHRGEYVGRTVRVEGIVEEGSLESRAGSLDYRFSITKGGKSIRVRYHGIMPDTFREGGGVVAQGRLGRSDLFVADQVMAKCPSKYEMQEKRASGQEAPHARPR